MNSGLDTIRLHVIIEGRVQGVGFRYATLQKAVSLGLTGWVSNRDDGRVEAEFEGTKDFLEAMLAWCKTGPRFADVENVLVEWSTSNIPYTEFRIRG